ncbi:MAG: AAA family ATPase [bacterium]|nr:AAA family ATPase [bacterium]
MNKPILITGIAGSGKSSICKHLLDLGYESYGIEDIEGIFAMYRKGTKEIFDDYENSDPEKIKNSEWLFDESKLKALLNQQKNEVAFYCGVASNMNDLVALFDQTILLKTNPKELHRRLSTREGTEDIGNTEESRQVVLGWKDWWENEMVEKGATVIDANREIKEVAKKVLEKSL